MNENFDGNTLNENNEYLWSTPYERNSPYETEYEYKNSYQYPNEARYPTEDPFYTNYNSKEQKKAELKPLFNFMAIVASISIIGLFSFAAYKEISGTKKGYSSGFSSGTSNYGINPDANPIVLNELKGDEEGLSAQKIYQDIVKSTVGIVVYDTNSDIIGKETSVGTGVIVSSDGYIVTNAHVIGNSKKSNVTVVLGEDKEKNGHVVGFDIRTDLAVIKIEETGLHPVTFGDSDQIAVGSSVLAIGNPGGLDFSNSLTRGIISATNRSLDASGFVKYLQTDAAINAGNSGGPLVDMYGRVIGINSAKISHAGYEGMGFAIPSKLVKTITDDIIKQGYVSGRVRIGAELSKVPVQYQYSGLPQGLIIRSLAKDSDLNNKGVRAGDIITKVDDKSITSAEEFINYISKKSPGEKINLSIFRKQSRGRILSNSTTFDVSISLLEDKGETQETQE